MKTRIILLSAIWLLSLNSCKQNTDPKAMLENSETRTELITDILNNHNYMTEFMESMQGNDHAMQMMQGNKKMIGSKYQDSEMQMMMKDSMMMKNMMQGMMKDGNMMGNMMNMMHKNGMMSKECMQSCMKMMNDKGMDMKGVTKMDMNH